MANRRRNAGLNAALFGATGWLFADLLLALAMLFLLAEPAGQFVAGPPTPTPQVVCTPVPTPLAVLDLSYIPVTVTIDFNGILGNNPAAVTSAEQQVRSQLASYSAQRVGLVEASGGSQGYGPGPATDLATAFMTNVLADLGKQGFMFYPQGNVLYQPFFTPNYPPSIMSLKIFVFTTQSLATPAPNTTCVTPTPLG